MFLWGFEDSKFFNRKLLGIYLLFNLLIIYYCCFFYNKKKLSTLSKDKYGNNCFHIAAKRINITVIRYLLRKFKR
jgi:ankyrin repeat protein